LLAVKAQAKPDTLTILLDKAQPDNANPVEALRYAKMGLQLAEKRNNAKLQEDFMYASGVNYYYLHDYPRSIEMAFRGLELSEEIGDKEYHSTFLYGMSVCYADAGDLSNAIIYARKDLEWLKKTHVHAKEGNQQTISVLYHDIALYQLQEGKPDSALSNMQQSYQIAGAIHYSGVRLATLGLGMIEERLGHQELAQAYYRLAITQNAGIDHSAEVQARIRLARIYQQGGKVDSAFSQAQAAYRLAERFPDHQDRQETAAMLSGLYAKSDELKSLRYYKIASLEKNSLDIAQKSKDFQIVTAREKQRQIEREEEKQKEEAERRENLQLIAIALFIPAFLLVVLQLPKTRIHRRLVDFLGIVSLLLLFEFITLLIHPWAGKITHHIPVLELLILVVLSAVLAPLHHKLDHWFKHRTAAAQLARTATKTDTETGPASETVV